MGLGGLKSEDAPVLVEALAGIKVYDIPYLFAQFYLFSRCCKFQVIDVAAGGWHSVAVSAFNDLYVWGWNVNGQCGLPLFETYETVQKNGEKRVEHQKLATVFASPVIVDLPKQSSDAIDSECISDNQYHPVAVSAGSRHTIIKNDDGTVMASGWNKYGQLANGKPGIDCDRFLNIKATVFTADEVICGDWSTLVISTD